MNVRKLIFFYRYKWSPSICLMLIMFVYYITSTNSQQMFSYWFFMIWEIIVLQIIYIYLTDINWLFCDCICIDYKYRHLKANNNHFTHVFLTYFNWVHQSLNIYWINISRLDANSSRNVFWTIFSHGFCLFRNIYWQTVNECSKNLYSDTIQQQFAEYSYNVH